MIKCKVKVKLVKQMELLCMHRKKHKHVRFFFSSNGNQLLTNFWLFKLKDVPAGEIDFMRHQTTRYRESTYFI
jgi:hypothetical protein